MAKTADSGLIRLREDIKNNTLSSLYLIYGEEDFLKEYYVGSIRQKILNGVMDDFNFLKFEGAAQDKNEIAIALDTPPVMADKKLILIKYSTIFKSATEDLKKFWTDVFENIDDETCIVFCEDSVDKRGVLYKAASKYGVCAECRYMEGTELKNWISRGVREAGKRISNDNIEYLISKCDKGMNSIKRELEKLFSYCEETITSKDIDKIVTKLPQSQVFDMINAMLRKDSVFVFQLLSDMRTLNESPNMIMENLANKLMQLLSTKILCENSYPPAKIAEKIKVPPYYAGDYISAAKKFSKPFLVSAIRECSDIVYAMNSGLSDKWTAVEQFLAKCMM